MIDGMRMISLNDLIGQHEHGNGSGKRPLPEAQIATLREAAMRYTAPCPFRVGDLVTPRKGYRYHDAGLPHIVLEVSDDPIRTWPADEPNSSGFGPRLDVRVANFASDGTVVAFWQESWCLERFDPQA